MADVVYRFVASDVSSVTGAFETVATAAESSSKRVQKSFSSSARAAKASAKKTAESSKSSGGGPPANIKRINDMRNAVIRAAKEETRALKGERRKQARDAKKAASDSVKAAEKAAEARVRAEENAQKKIRATRTRMMGLAGEAALRATGAVMAGVTAIAGKSVREGIALEDYSTKLAIKGGAPMQGVSGRQLASTFSLGARQTKGMKAQDLAKSFDEFVTKTGRADLAMDFQDVFSKVSLATGTKIGDVSKAGADIFTQAGITDKSQMMDVLSTLAVQGKHGAFEMEDMAARMPKMLASFKRFGFGKDVGGVEGVKTLGAMTQIARRSTGSGAEAATSVENLFREMTMDQKTIRGLTGVDVFKVGAGGMKESKKLEELIPQLIAGGDADPGAMQDIFGTRGVKAVSSLIDMYKELRKTGMDREEAEAHLTKVIQGGIEKKGAAATMEADAARMQETTAAKLTHAWETVKDVANAQLLPVIGELVNKFAEVATSTDLISHVAEFLMAMGEAALFVTDVLQSMGLLAKSDHAADLARRKRDRDVLMANTELGQLSDPEQYVGKAKGPKSWKEEKKKYDNITAMMADLSAGGGIPGEGEGRGSGGRGAAMKTYEAGDEQSGIWASATKGMSPTDQKRYLRYRMATAKRDKANFVGEGALFKTPVKMSLDQANEGTSWVQQLAMGLGGDPTRAEDTTSIQKLGMWLGGGVFGSGLTALDTATLGGTADSATAAKRLAGGRSEGDLAANTGLVKVGEAAAIAAKNLGELGAAQLPGGSVFTGIASYFFSGD